MFGKRSVNAPPTRDGVAAPWPAMETRAAASLTDSRRSHDYDLTRSMIFGALVEATDLSRLAQDDAESARDDIRDIVSEIIAIKNVVLSMAEQEDLLEDICADALGYGPIEPLLARDDVAGIMVNGANRIFIDVGGAMHLTGVRFRDTAQLITVCQRMVGQSGHRLDASAPVCDARLADGSRVHVVLPPLAIDGPVLTIRKFRSATLSLEQLIRLGALSPEGAEILKIIARARCNVLISGPAGAGKTTLLNGLAHAIDGDERVITCEDAAELRLPHPHVVRLETRPPDPEGQGAVTMRDLVQNGLRMRPERLIVGDLRGPEAFDLLEAMSAGHDGSMATLRAHSPREALSRLETMILMGGLAPPPRAIARLIFNSVDVIVQTARLRDGSRRITHISEIAGLEGDVPITRDLYVFDVTGEDAHGLLKGRHRSTRVARPRFWERARACGEEQRLAAALDAAESRG
jgi:pilus assembly protein CpaF